MLKYCDFVRDAYGRLVYCYFRVCACELGDNDIIGVAPSSRRLALLVALYASCSSVMGYLRGGPRLTGAEAGGAPDVEAPLIARHCASHSESSDQHQAN